MATASSPRYSAILTHSTSFLRIAGGGRMVKWIECIEHVSPFYIQMKRRARFYFFLHSSSLVRGPPLQCLIRGSFQETYSSSRWAGALVGENTFREAIARLKQQPGQDIRIAGSPTLVRSLMLST